MLAQALSPAQHRVQFYQNSEFLIVSVKDFLIPGLLENKGAIVIATPEHLDLLRTALDTAGIHHAALEARGQLKLLNCHTCLESFFSQAMPDPKLFDQYVGELVRQMLSKYPKLLAFGEMVNVLYKDGNTIATLKLEELWNKLLHGKNIDLLCGYEINHFHDHTHDNDFHGVCQAHSHIRPTEEFEALNSHDQALMIASLQQKAIALENELKHRERIELELKQMIDKRDEFLSVAGHELKTPLTSMMIHLQMMQKAVISDEVKITDQFKNSLERSNAQGYRLAHLIDQLLDITRMRSGKLELHRSYFDVQDLFKTVAPRLALEYRSKSSLIMKTSSPVFGNFDKARLEQVMTNLLSNAIKYGKNNPIEISISSLDSGVEITIQDFGIGMNSLESALVFNRFERISQEYNSGLGLGLYIVKQIIEAHQGEIQVRSFPQQGTTFTLTLPLLP